jgi:hypothetical protein
MVICVGPVIDVSRSIANFDHLKVGVAAPSVVFVIASVSIKAPIIRMGIRFTRT